MSCELVFIDKLKEKGFRLTMQREIVLSVLHGFSSAVSAEEIYNRVQEISSAVDISTVYRTLELLQDFGMVISSDIGGDHRVYNLVSVEEPHIHLVCKECGQVLGIETDPAEKLASYLESHHNFLIDLKNFHISGLCEDCQEKGISPK